MPYPAYSTRFIAMGDAETEQRFTVPHGKRAVVTHINFTSMGVAPSGLSVYVAQKIFWIASIQAPWTSLAYVTRHVVYAMEQIMVQRNQNAAHVLVSGYLLEDPYGPPAAGKPVEPGRPEITPLSA